MGNVHVGVRKIRQKIKLQKCGRRVNSGVVALNGMAYYPLNKLAGKFN
jgi:hypothetical protein